MDQLLRNLPHAFPKRADTQAIVKQAAAVAHIADDEAQHADKAEHCDQTFFDGIVEELEGVGMSVLLYGRRYRNICLQEFPDHDLAKYVQEFPDHDPAQHMQDAVAVIQQIFAEVLRLDAHSGIFNDVRQRSHFFLQVRDLIEFTEKLLQVIDEREDFRQLAKDDDPTRTTPFNNTTQRKFQPWESFGRRIKINEDSAAFTEIQKVVPDMRMLFAQQLPQSAVLIAERYRQKVETIVTGIMQTSTHPEVVEKQLPGRDGAINGEKIVEGASAQIRREAAMHPINENTRQGLAFGKQEHIAEMGRLMALYDRDVTTQNRKPPAAFLATFFSKEGLQIAQETWEEGDDDELFELE